jgi:MFS family permease
MKYTKRRLTDSTAPWLGKLSDRYGRRPFFLIGPAWGTLRARSHCRFVPPLIHFIPDLLTYSVPLFLKRQCDRTLGTLQNLLVALYPRNRALFCVLRVFGKAFGTLSGSTSPGS